jgi:hypothetical protein
MKMLFGRKGGPVKPPSVNRPKANLERLGSQAVPASQQADSNAVDQVKGHASGVPDNRLADDLTRRVFLAIHDWSIENDLRSIPPEIVFDQALSILNLRKSLREEYKQKIRRH